MKILYIWNWRWWWAIIVAIRTGGFPLKKLPWAITQARYVQMFRHNGAKAIEVYDAPLSFPPVFFGMPIKFKRKIFYPSGQYLLGAPLGKSVVVDDVRRSYR